MASGRRSTGIRPSRLNQANTGLAYSGEYGFAETEMFWSLTHMVQPKEQALRCYDCHGENGRMDWAAWATSATR